MWPNDTSLAERHFAGFGYMCGVVEEGWTSVGQGEYEHFSNQETSKQIIRNIHEEISKHRDAIGLSCPNGTAKKFSKV